MSCRQVRSLGRASRDVRLHQASLGGLARASSLGSAVPRKQRQTLQDFLKPELWDSHSFSATPLVKGVASPDWRGRWEWPRRLPGAPWDGRGGRTTKGWGHKGARLVRVVIIPSYNGGLERESVLQSRGGTGDPGTWVWTMAGVCVCVCAS